MPSPARVDHDRPRGVRGHYPDGLSGAHPFRVWTLRGALKLNAASPFLLANPGSARGFGAPLSRLLPRRPAATQRAMPRLTPLTRLRAPLGGQEIELHQIDHDAGGMSLLRTRIREKSRFTVFDIDPLTARAWGEALLRWAQGQPGGAGPAGTAGAADEATR